MHLRFVLIIKVQSCIEVGFCHIWLCLQNPTVALPTGWLSVVICLQTFFWFSTAFRCVSSKLSRSQRSHCDERSVGTVTRSNPSCLHQSTNTSNHYAFGCITYNAVRCRLSSCLDVSHTSAHTRNGQDTDWSAHGQRPIITKHLLPPVPQRPRYQCIMTVGRWRMHRLCTPSSLALHGSCIEIKSETFGRIKLIRQRSNGLVKHVEPGPQHKTKQGLRRLGPCGIAWQVSLQVHASSSLSARFLAEVCYLLSLSTHRSTEFLHHMKAALLNLRGIQSAWSQGKKKCRVQHLLVSLHVLAQHDQTSHHHVLTWLDMLHRILCADQSA